MPNADLERLNGRGFELSYCSDNFKSSSYRAFGIILMGARIGEVGENAATHEFGN